MKIKMLEYKKKFFINICLVFRQIYSAERAIR
jgi:hypothetical protein